MQRKRNAINPQSGLSRRDLLRLGVGLGAGAVMPRRARAAGEPLIERAIPRTAEKLPAIGLGTWQTFDVAGDAKELAAARSVLQRFAELGGRVVDSSPMYGSAESVVGDLAAELGLQKTLFLATKVWVTGRDEGIRQMETSLQRMRAARMDLMQVHNLVDVATHLATLRESKRAGKIRYLGVTHYHSGAYPELERLLKREKLDFVQLNYSLAEPEAERRLLPLAAETGTAVIVNRPFATGAMFSQMKGKPLPAWAAEIGCRSWGQFFLKWILGHPAVTCVIPATRNPKHLEDNMGAGRGPLPDAAARKRMAEHFRRA